MKKTKEAIRVLLVGDNEATRKELNQMLDNEEGITVVSTAGSGKEALAAAKKLSLAWFFMLTDIRIPGMNIIDTTCAITKAQLHAKVIIITKDFPRYLVPAIKAGAAGLLPQDINRDRLPPYVTYTCGLLGYPSPSNCRARSEYHSINWLSGGVTM